MTDLQALFSTEPASFQWAAGDGRTIGTAAGAVLDLWPGRAELTAIFPPDNADLAARNGALLLLLLTATRPGWQTAGDWLTFQMRSAARGTRDQYEATNYTRGVTFRYDRQQSRATLRVLHRDTGAKTGA